MRAIVLNKSRYIVPLFAEHVKVSPRKGGKNPHNYQKTADNKAMRISRRLQKNVARLKELIKSQDVVYYEGKSGTVDFCVVYVDSVTDKNQVGLLVLTPLSAAESESADECKRLLNIPNVVEKNDLADGAKELLNGKTLVFFDGDDGVLACDFLAYQTRAVAEPPTAVVVKGPREGFTECLKTNLGLLRRRIKVNDFTIETVTIGKYSQSTVAVCYIGTITDPDIVKEVKRRLKLVDIDGIPDSSYVGKLIVDHKTSLFKQFGTTEKPDVLSQKMLEGRVGIIVDGSPIALTVPYLLTEDFQSSEDYFVNNYRANMERGIRLFSLIFAIFLPALFVSAQLFHLQIIPLNFLLTIVNSVKGIPLSPSFEMFFTFLIFEILNEASIRMPKYVGMALSIVGALVLGDTAVKAGIVSTPTIMIMALSGICLYTVPELVDSMSVLRFVYLVAAGTIGGYGIVLTTAYLILYLCSLENFGVPLLAPFAPSFNRDKKDALYIDFITEMRERPQVLGSKNRVRQRIKDVRR